MEEKEEELASSPSELQFSSGRFIPHYFNYYKREMTRRMRRRRARNARGRSRRSGARSENVPRGRALVSTRFTRTTRERDRTLTG